MPGPALHFVLALEGSQAFATPEERSAYLTGSVGPDMGYFPGGEPLLSDLAHYVSSGRLTAALARRALSADRVAVAFARGWATHVVADALFHPLVNRAAHELLRGTWDGLLTFADDPVSHIRVEQGLDAVIGSRFPVPGPDRAITRSTVQLLASAYQEIYGFQPTNSLARSCRALARGFPFLVRYRRLAVTAWSGNGVTRQAAAAVLAVTRFATAVARGSPPYAFARPVPPSETFLSEVLRTVREFPAQFAAFEEDGFASLLDKNLDTGEPEDVPYSLSAVTREKLVARTKQR